MNLISSVSVIESPFSIPLDPNIPLPVLTSTVYWCEIFLWVSGETDTSSVEHIRFTSVMHISKGRDLEEKPAAKIYYFESESVRKIELNF